VCIARRVARTQPIIPQSVHQLTTGLHEVITNILPLRNPCHRELSRQTILSILCSEECICVMKHRYLQIASERNTTCNLFL
jgi:hypothetical protein